MKLTWILVADSARARVFSAETPSSPLQELEDFTHNEGRLHDREITSDLSGRIRSSGAGGHSYELPTDPKKHEIDNFAHYLADYLEDAHNANRFEQLIIVAGPTFLGLLRDNLSKHIKPLVILEVDKELTGFAADDIRRHLPEYLPAS